MIFMANVTILQHDIVPIAEQPVEYVERKGKGHPDSLIDGIVERCSVELCKRYIEATGSILHYNVDKGLIIGGSSEAEFGKARITRPIEIIITGRATQEFKGGKINVDEIAIKAIMDHLRENTRFLDLNDEITTASKILKGSADLAGMFHSASDVPLANDTSFGIGFAPFTETESIVLETERYLNSSEYKKLRPYVGEDIKVMGVKEHDRLTLTIAIAMVSPLIANSDDYMKYKSLIADDVRSFASKRTKRELEIVVNNSDIPEQNLFYLTKSGLSCEAGDDGSVGRGNRVNGLITPFRNMSLEAASGKNPVSHVGKIYGILSNEIASDVVKLYPEIKDCTVSIVSQIGRKIDDPRNLAINVVMERGKRIDPIVGKVRDIAEDSLLNIADLTRDIAEGKFTTY
jgi:S-adenosylmethionine synthetase